MADLNTLPNFAYRYRAQSNYVGGAPDAYALGTSWTDDAGANALLDDAFSAIPANTNRLGRVQTCSIVYSNSATETVTYKISGTNLDARNFGCVICGQFPYGPIPAAVRTFWWHGLGTNFEFAMSENLYLQTSEASGANPVIYSPAKRVPVNPTIVMLDSSGTDTWVKVLGLSSTTGAVATSTVNNAWLGLFGNAGGGSSSRLRYGIDEIAFFNASGTVRNNAAAIEADLISRYPGIAIPTKGHVICLGDSLGDGSFQFGSQSWPAYIGNQLNDWFVVNNSRSGISIAGMYAVRATYIDNANDRPLGSGKPTLFYIYLGANDLIANRTNVQMQADMTQLVSYIRTTYPTCGITVGTLTPHVLGGDVNVVSQDAYRLLFNAWLRGGGLSAYGVNVADLALTPSFIPAGTSAAQIRAVTQGTNYDIYTAAFAVTQDQIHWGQTGMNNLAALFQSSAAEGARDLLVDGTFRDRARGRPLMAVR